MSYSSGEMWEAQRAQRSRPMAVDVAGHLGTCFPGSPRQEVSVER